MKSFTAPQYLEFIIKHLNMLDWHHRVCLMRLIHCTTTIENRNFLFLKNAYASVRSQKKPLKRGSICCYQQFLLEHITKSNFFVSGNIDAWIRWLLLSYFIRLETNIAIHILNTLFTSSTGFTVSLYRQFGLLQGKYDCSIFPFNSFSLNCTHTYTKSNFRYILFDIIDFVWICIFC